ncbi:toprim domain-containing protein [Candidatus Woesearchaeota archaeon]|nr:toprim domain-containing protein [Candidatus Woesearchaeota archaeon]
MKPPFKEIIEEVWEAIDKYKHDFVLVEGKNDRAALESLGFNSVRAINANKPLYEIIEEVNEKKVLILTDLDKEGKQIYSRLKKGLESRGVFVDDTLRNLLFKTELRQVEGLYNYLKRF